jgi:hypothetical protein
MSNHYAVYSALVVTLKEIAKESKSRAISDPPDDLILSNLNFYAKAYLISLCTYLEAFLQDLAASHVDQARERISVAKIPGNLVRWSIHRETKEKDYAFSDFQLPLTRKDLEDELSGNPGRTIALFKKIGIDLASDPDFQNVKSVVGAVVEKRNSIIHKNDEAADLSLDDIITYADQFLSYMKAINSVVLRLR